MNSSNALSKGKMELNKMKSKDIFKSLKSDYFLQKLFNNLLKKKTLNIVKYNRNIKKRMNINIKDYKEYSEIYSSIEIEIKPVKDEYSLFIYMNEENKIYYHIYFDNNKEEIKRNYLNKNEQIKTIKIIIDYQVKSFESLFYNCDCIESIYFKKFYRNNITNMGGMFSGCSSLKEINLNNFNTNNVTSMSEMFSGCSSLKEINFQGFSTNKVTDMNNMFNGCSALKELNLSSFNTDKVTDMNFMFYGCYSLEKINVSSFNINKLESMNLMFCLCSSLKEINISDPDFSNVKYMNHMFYGCPGELKKKIKEHFDNFKEESF